MHGRSTFPKRERLQWGWQFRHVYETGRRVEGRLAVLYVLDEPPAEATTGPATRAVGIVTGRKIGGAVQRNRARRLLREAYRLNKQKLKPNLQIVIVARTGINGKKFQEVEKALLNMFQTAGALVES